MEYKIVRCDEDLTLNMVADIHELMDRGWVPLGGIAVRAGSTSGAHLLQAMTRTVKQKKEPVKRFVKPTKQQLQAHKADKGLNFDVNAFLDFYESCGWTVGRKPMKSWTHAVSNWIRNNKNFTPTAKADSRVNTNQPKAFNVGKLDNEANKLTKTQIDEMKSKLIRR